MKNRVLLSALYREHDPFGIFGSTKIVHRPNDLQEDGVLILWGGQDISPKIYKQANTFSHADDKPSARDLAEMALAQEAIKMGIPVIGVCRGAQLMCALSGGSLYQHVDGHQSSHDIYTEDGIVLRTNSIHHQMMNPFNIEHRMIAYSNDRRSKVYLTDRGEEEHPEVEPEIVYFPTTRCLAIQGHPEYLNPRHELVEYCSSKIKELF